MEYSQVRKRLEWEFHLIRLRLEEAQKMGRWFHAQQYEIQLNEVREKLRTIQGYTIQPNNKKERKLGLGFLFTYVTNVHR